MRARLLAGTMLALMPVMVGATETVSYTYDAKGRLTNVAHSGGPESGETSAYTFDAADNRTNMTVSGATSTGASAATVSNAGFESPDAGSGYTYNPTASGATFAGNTGVAANGSAWSFASAPDGKQVAFVQTAGSSAGQITLAVSGMQSGQNYAVVFKAAQRPNFPVNPITVQFGGATLGTFSPGSTSFDVFASSSFQATGSTGSITFTGLTTSTDISTGIDSVAVVPLPIETNTSFEAPDQGSGYAYTPSAPGVTFSGQAGIAANGSDWGFASAPDGKQVAFLQGLNGASGQFTLSLSNLTVGTSYKLVFQAAQRPQHGTNPITVTVGGQSLGTFTPGSTQFQSFQTATFTASAALMQAMFAGTTSSGDIGSGVDAVAVVPVNSS